MVGAGEIVWVAVPSVGSESYHIACHSHWPYVQTVDTIDTDLMNSFVQSVPTSTAVYDVRIHHIGNIHCSDYRPQSLVHANCHPAC